MSTESNRAFLEFWRGLDPQICDCLNERHVQDAIAKAELNGWTDWEWLTNFARRDTNGLRPGPAAAKILNQLRDGAAIVNPNRSNQPPDIQQVRATMNHGHQPSTEATTWADNIRQQLRGRTA